MSAPTFSNAQGPLEALCLPAVEIGQLVATSGATLVDLRSPGEFAEDRLPGAINVPLFDDLERSVVGTLYKQVSPEGAFEEGFQRARLRVAELVGAIAAAAGASVDTGTAQERMEALAQGGQRALEGRLQLIPVASLPARPLVLHCWRGGLRSQSVTALVRCLGLPALVLNGGYRAYRREVTQLLEQARWPRTYVLRGLTGVGKSLVLRAIEQTEPGCTLDLEALAQHRSSVLGMVGLEPVSQKAFDSALALRLKGGFGHRGGALAQRPWMVVEGESRKVGNVTLPASLWQAMELGQSLELNAPLEVRVENLIADYLQSPTSRTHLASQLPFIEARLGSKFRGQLSALLADHREQELVRLLLEHYYDPLYRHSEGEHTCLAQFGAHPPEVCAGQVLAWIQRSEETRSH